LFVSYVTALPKLIDVPETVPTNALPSSTLGVLSLVVITILLFVLSKQIPPSSLLPLKKTTAVPKLIEVPLTVPTIAVP
jgi:hypothetical protein